MSMSIKILLVDDHMIVRQGLKALLEKEHDLEVIAEASNGNEAIRLAHELAPDVIVMDMQMREMNGVEASRRILENNPAHKIIILSMALDRSCVSEALKNGVKGYVIKECASGELVAAIRAVMAGGAYLCHEAAELVVKGYISDSGERHSDDQSSLSYRELETLRLIADGKNSKEIAFYFGVSAKTIDAQRLKIMKKLNLHSVAELTKYAVREGLAAIE